MVIPGDEVISKSIVGKLGNKILWAISTIGGLNLIEARSPDGSKQIIGAGNHRAVARHVAKRSHEDIEWSMLEKSAEVDIRDIEDLMPFWQAVVERVNQKLS